MLCIRRANGTPVIHQAVVKHVLSPPRGRILDVTYRQFAADSATKVSLRGENGSWLSPFRPVLEFQFFSFFFAMPIKVGKFYDRIPREERK